MRSYASFSPVNLSFGFGRSSLLVAFVGLVVVAWASSPASAVITFNVDVETESGESFARVGEEVTLKISMTSDAEPFYGIGASVYGYEISRARFDRGEAVSSAFNGICIPGFGCLGGITNLAIPLVEDPSVPRVRFFLGIGPSPVQLTGLDDFGIDGFRIADGDYHASVTFEMLLPGVTRFEIGDQLPDDAVLSGEDGSTQQSMNAFVEILVVPEPSAALLIGLGLIGLCQRGRAGREA